MSYKSVKYRLYPTKVQKELLDKHFGCVRFVYNYFLNERIEEYKNNKKSLSYNQQANSLTKLKQELYWLKEINAQSLQQSLMNLDEAYKNFFKHKKKFPKFKSKKNKKDSFRVPQNVLIENNKLFVWKFSEGIKLDSSVKTKQKIKQCTISKSPTGKYFVSVLYELNNFIPFEKTGKSIGLDLGLKDFLVCSDGTKVPNLKRFKQYEKKLKLVQQHFSRKQTGSNRREKQRIKVAKIYEKITNVHKDFLHKLSHKLVKENDLICLEDLNIKGLIKNRKLSKNISDVAWGTFVQLLTYKANWNDKKVVKINRFFPSSKTCFNCKKINKQLKLWERTWICEGCETTLDRDLNAARNIHSLGTSENRHREEIRPEAMGLPIAEGIFKEVSKVLNSDIQMPRRES